MVNRQPRSRSNMSAPVSDKNKTHFSAPNIASAESDSTDDDDDSNSEDYRRFKESAVEFTTIGSTTSKVRRTNSTKTLPPSLRNTPNLTGADEDWNELNTTPTFRNHVAKKLTQMLERSVDMIETRSPSDEVPAGNRESDSPGVKLFSTSANTMAMREGGRETVSAKRRKQMVSSSDSDSDEEMARFAAAAVSGVDILKKAKEPCPWKNDSQEIKEDQVTKPIHGPNGDVKTVKYHVSEGGITDPNDLVDLGENSGIDGSCLKKQKRKKHKKDIKKHSDGDCEDIEGLEVNEMTCGFGDRGSDQSGAMSSHTVKHNKKDGAMKKKKKKAKIMRSADVVDDDFHHYGKKKKCKHRHNEKT